MAARAPVPMPAQRRPSMTVLDVTALRRTFGGLVAVQGIDFSIAASEVVGFIGPNGSGKRSEEHTSELQSLMRISYAVFCLKKKNIKQSDIDKTQVFSINN